MNPGNRSSILTSSDHQSTPAICESFIRIDLPHGRHYFLCPIQHINSVKQNLIWQATSCRLDAGVKQFRDHRLLVQTGSFRLTNGSLNLFKTSPLASLRTKSTDLFCAVPQGDGCRFHDREVFCVCVRLAAVCQTDCNAGNRYLPRRRQIGSVHLATDTDFVESATHPEFVTAPRARKNLEDISRTICVRSADAGSLTPRHPVTSIRL